MASPHLKSLEAESIHIFREVAASFERPVLLYSAGKDSSVLLHLAMKAFFPSKPPFPLLHVDTGWQFRETIAFRDATASKLGLELLVHTGAEGPARGIDPFDQPTRHIKAMKTEALEQALDEHRFDAAIGGDRRDEGKTRAGERVFSVRSASHLRDPKNQRPEFWRLYNGRINPGESVRAFPLSSWTETDIWRYIRAEDIPVAPPYFAAKRPMVERDGTLIVADDDRVRLRPGERIVEKTVRFRTLGCYPLTGAIESAAATLDDIIGEMLVTRTSGRSRRRDEGCFQ